MFIEQCISADFPYESKFIDVHGSNMHYIEAGEGEPILFLHGIPTWSYLWRNVIPPVSKYGRCIAVDLIGMGLSDKPDIKYRVFDHIHYINEFIEAMGLKKITMVLHGWGSVVGFNYAMQYEKNMAGLAFLESHIRPVDDWRMVSLPVHEMTSLLASEDNGYDVIMNSNYYVNKVLPSGVLRNLSEKEMEHYREPFKEVSSCLPIWQFLQDLPLGDAPQDVVKLISDYSEALQLSSLPKLMMYALPGFITTMDTVQWASEHLHNLSLVDIGEALHYAQESNPSRISEELCNWYAECVQR